MAATITTDSGLIYQEIENKDWDKLRDIIMRRRINLDAIHQRDLGLGFEVPIVMMVLDGVITLEDFATMINLFISLGLGTNLLTPLYYYFMRAIVFRNHQMIAFLIEKAGNRFKEYLGPHQRQFTSIFWYALISGDPKTIGMLVDAGVDVDQPIQDNFYLYYPVHIVILHQKTAALRYLIEIGANINIPEFRPERTPVPFYSLFLTKSTRHLISKSHNADMIELYNNAFINIENRELNLERRVFLRLIIDEIQLDDVAKYIQSNNYTWLANTHSESPLVLQAKAKIKQYAAERKRQREN